MSPSSLISENLECLTEKVGTLGLQVTRKNCCGAAKKRARKAKFGEAPTGDSGSGQPRPAPDGQPQTLQKPGTSGAQHGQGLSSAGLKSLDSKGYPQGPSTQQLSAKGTPEGRQAKRPRQSGQVGYARATQEGTRVAVLGEDYP